RSGSVSDAATSTGDPGRVIDKGGERTRRREQGGASRRVVRHGRGHHGTGRTAQLKCTRRHRRGIDGSAEGRGHRRRGNALRLIRRGNDGYLKRLERIDRRRAVEGDFGGGQGAVVDADFVHAAAEFRPEFHRL